MRENSIVTRVPGDVGRIGLGCVTFGREIDQNAAFRIMDEASEHGISFFDTAGNYGAGASETIIGNWLASRRPGEKTITIATKVLPPFDAQNLERSVDESLKRLGVDRIDVLYLHRWDETLHSDICFIALDKLAQQGKVKTLGASNFTAEQLRNAVNRQTIVGMKRFQYAQNNHNLAVSDINDVLKDVCVANEIRLISYSSLGAGYLTGKYRHGLETGSRFDVVPGHQNIYFNEKSNRRLLKLLDIATQTGYSAAHLALAWAFHQQGIDCVLVGARSTEHVKQALTALRFNETNILNELESA